MALMKSDDDTLTGPPRRALEAADASGKSLDYQPGRPVAATPRNANNNGGRCPSRGKLKLAGYVSLVLAVARAGAAGAAENVEGAASEEHVEPGTVFEFGVDMTSDDGEEEEEGAGDRRLASMSGSLAVAGFQPNANAVAALSGGLLNKNNADADDCHKECGCSADEACKKDANGCECWTPGADAAGAATTSSASSSSSPSTKVGNAHLDFTVTALEVGSDRALMVLTLLASNDPATLRPASLRGASLFYEETRAGGISESWGPEGQDDVATEALRALLQFTSGNQDFATELEEGDEAAEMWDKQEGKEGSAKLGAKLTPNLRSEMTRVVAAGVHKGLKVDAVRTKLRPLGGLVSTRVTVSKGKRSRTVDAKVRKMAKLGGASLVAKVRASKAAQATFHAGLKLKLKSAVLKEGFMNDVVGAGDHAALMNGGKGRMLFPGGQCGGCKKKCTRKWYCLWFCTTCTWKKSCTRQFAAMDSTCYFVYERLKGMDCVSHWNGNGPQACPGTGTTSWGSWFTCFFAGVEMTSGGDVNAGGTLGSFKHSSGWVGNPPRLHEYRKC